MGPHDKQSQIMDELGNGQPLPIAAQGTPKGQSMTTNGISSLHASPTLTAAVQRSPTKDGLGERITLTTYPGQSGINPLPLHWGAPTAAERGPILASRLQTPLVNNLKERNAIGAFGGSYCIYHALAVGSGVLKGDHRPDFTDTEPPFKIGPYPQWSESPMKIVSMDPFGHLVQTDYQEYLERGYDLRPTIAVTRAHMIIPEFARGTFKVDGNVVLNEEGELNVTKAAIEPVWWLPGVASRFGIDENKLRRALFEDTGGMYPELITRPDLKVFLPPIGGLTIYVFGPIEYLADPTKKVTLRVHDECNGSDVFGSDICTCRPYLIYGIQRCVETAQQGGVGLIVYFRKEGRALGEVTKFLVYNARKRQAGGDRASTYFQRTENIAGVQDMRFQALMPDVLHWLGIRKVDEMISMSNLKYEAIVGAGIPVLERIPIPDCMLPLDSQVEMEAKIAAGYFTKGHIPTQEELDAVKGRTWDDILH